MGEVRIASGQTVLIEPLGDQALLVSVADEALAQNLAATVRQEGWKWLVDVVVAYRSVAVFYDQNQVDYARVSEAVRSLRLAEKPISGRLFQIPCCYELGPDLEQVAQLCQCHVSEVIAWHSGTIYTVYAIGFVPGFPYLGYLPERLAGVPRLDKPRRQVEPGSVGLAGRQTGIYPSAVPGGWRIVGRTPLIIADPEKEFFPLRIGDRVQFVPISRREFEQLYGKHLESDYSANRAST